MTTHTHRRSLSVLPMASVLSILFVAGAAAQQMPQTTTEKIKGTSKVATEQLKGTVSYVEGNSLVVRMSTGEIREFQVPETRKFIVDGQELSVHQLKIGTKLTATVTTTTTPVTERTTTIGSGKVWYVAGNTVILTLPNNENRMYKVQESYRFNVDGKPASVHDLRKGMQVSAEKIVEAPLTEIASNTSVVGEAPPAPKPERAQITHTPAPVREAPPAPRPTEVAAAPTPTPTVEPVPAAEAPTGLPATGSPVPLAGFLGLLFTGASFGLRKLRR